MAKKKARKKRVYKKGAKGSEYDSYHGKPRQKKRRALRNKSNRAAKRAGRIKKGDGKHAHHPGKLTGRTVVMSGRANQRKGSPGRKR